MLTPGLSEQEDLLARFIAELRKPTGDGARKRARAEKPPWYLDVGHEAAMYRHLDVYEAGERFDPDSGCHPLVSVAWRALAIACKDVGNVPNG